jgi:hypothetical protein
VVVVAETQYSALRLESALSWLPLFFWKQMS